MAVSLGRLFQSRTVRGVVEVGGGGGFFVFTVMRWYMVMEFKDTVQSVFSSAYLDGRPVEGWDHQVHT